MGDSEGTYLVTNPSISANGKIIWLFCRLCTSPAPVDLQQLQGGAPQVLKVGL